MIEQEVLLSSPHRTALWFFYTYIWTETQIPSSLLCIQWSKLYHKVDENKILASISVLYCAIKNMYLRFDKFINWNALVGDSIFIIFLIEFFIFLIATKYLNDQDFAWNDQTKTYFKILCNHVALHYCGQYISQIPPPTNTYLIFVNDLANTLYPCNYATYKQPKKGTIL